MSTWKQKVAAGFAAMALAIGLLPAIALAEEPELPAETPKADTEISVTGVTVGDTAAYYKVIGQDSTTNAWVLVEPFTNLNLKDLPGNAQAATQHPTWGDLDFILDGISAEEAGVIAANATVSGTTMTDDYTATVEPGLYLVLITPANGNNSVVYKPVFVAADYDQSEGSPNSVNVENAELPAPDVATAKKSPVTLEKTATTADNKPNGVAVGDTVSFTVTTCIPTYTTNFTDPVFKITDTLTDGLTLVQNSIEVAVGDYELTSDDYTVTPNDANDGYVVEFSESFLYKVSGGPDVTITYKATVTSDAPQQVNEMDNTVTLIFSNDPTDSQSQGTLTDKTRHYTFDIDGNVFGGGAEPGETKEVEKVGLDSNGDPIYEITTTQYPDGLPVGENPLADAEFELRAETADGTALKFNEEGVLDPINGTTVVKSEADGSITMKGLDEGTYYLVETKAPTGYTPDPNPKKIVIEATYVPDADNNMVLASYKITIDDENTSTYIVKNDAEGYPIELTDKENAEITANEGNVTSLFVNKKLGILPSTGGAGIYFYIVVGGAVAGVSAYLIRKTRKEEKLQA